METHRDTPLRRVGAFWIALTLIFSFGLVLLLLAPILLGKPQNVIEDETYLMRTKTKLIVDKAQKQEVLFKQHGNRAQTEPQHAFLFTGRKLIASSEFRTTVVVPGSDTDLRNNN